jgi:hypothetical protein
MDNETQELTPEEPARSEKRKGQSGRKKLKQQALRDKPPPLQPENSRFLARPWINLPPVNDAPAQHRVRVMTWNVCAVFLGVLSRS